MKKVKLTTHYFFLFSFWSSIALSFFLLLSVGVFYTLLPSEKELKGCLKGKMFDVEICPQSENYMSLKNIAPSFRQVIVVSEDGNFWTHSGFDFFELKNSIQTNLKKGTFARGGSTITQQLAKNLFLSQDKNLLRKLKEAFITVYLEKHLTKNEILEKYLNIIQYGDKLFGIKNASFFYFKKHPSQLLPEESAFLASLLPNPVKYSQSFRSGRLSKYMYNRINILLNRLNRLHDLSENDYLAANQRSQYMFGNLAQGASPKDQNFWDTLYEYVDDELSLDEEGAESRKDSHIDIDSEASGNNSDSNIDNADETKDDSSESEPDGPSSTTN